MINKCPKQLLSNISITSTAKVTINKHFSNAIYATRDSKLEPFFACGGRQSSLRLQKFRGGENFH